MIQSPSSLLKRVTLKDIVSRPTKPRIQNIDQQNDFDAPPVNNDDFSAAPIQDTIVEHAQPAIIDPPTLEAEEVEEDEHPEESAEALIDLIDVAQKTLFTLWASHKIKKKFPEKLLDEYVRIDIKDASGEELTDTEKRQFERYQALERRLDKVANDMPFTDDEKEDLMGCTQALVKKTGLKIPPGMWFGASLLSVLSKRFIDVQMSS